MADCNVLKLIFLFAIVFVSGTRAHLSDVECGNDLDCKFDEFCEASRQRCEKCVHCGTYNRHFAVEKCPKTEHECGNCLEGYHVAHSENTETVCESGEEIFTSRTLNSADETDSSAIDESEAAETWVYVVCVIAGLFLGFAVGGVGGILAYKLYFQNKCHRKQEHPDKKSFELHEMQSEARKYSSDSTERGEIAYGLIANNTKHFPNVQNFDARDEQEVIPLQGNAAPVVSNSLYYIDEDKGI